MSNSTERISRTSVDQGLTPEQLEFLFLGETEDGVYNYLWSSEAQEELWETHRDEVLREWLKEYEAGTRPFAWWKWDAPEPRRRVGGTGDTAQDARLNIKPEFSFGIPDRWVHPCEVETYNLRAVDIHGNPRQYSPRCREAYKDGFPYLTPDPNDPPTFESEANFLRRHDLFMRGEEKKLPEDAFDFEVLEVEAGK